VGNIIVEVELGHARQLLTAGKMIQVHLQRTFEGAARLHKGAVALVTDPDVFKSDAIEFEFGVHIFELDSHSRRQPITLAFGTLEVHARPTIARASEWAHHSTRPESRVEAGSDLGFV